MKKNYLFDEQIIPWFKTKTFKIIVLVLAILSIASVVLFSNQVGNLLELFGIKAGFNQKTILVDGVGSGAEGHSSFFEGIYSVEPTDSLTIDNTNRLILNDPNN